jgi:hypothetical protein
MSIPTPSLSFQAFESLYSFYESLSLANTKAYAGHVYAKISTYPSQLKNRGLQAYRKAILVWQNFTTKMQQAWIAVKDYARDKRELFIKTTFYKYNIEPLRKEDYTRLGVTVSIAGIVVIATWKFWVAGRPVICLGGTLAVIIAFHFCRRHVEAHFKEEAWECIEQIRLIAHQQIVFQGNQRLDLIETQQAELAKLEIGYLKEYQQKLDREIKNFKTLILSPPPTESDHFNQIKANFIQSLTVIQNQLAHYKTPSTLPIP